MSALTFTLKAHINQSVNCKALTPDQLQGKSIKDIQSIHLGTQNVAELFDLSGEDTSQITFKNTNNHLHYIGHKMKRGVITVEGNAGDYLGAAMQGGVLICKGNVGERAADLMRRGILLIEGNVGEYCASNMQAGTVGILGNFGARLGYGMRRGTLLLAQEPAVQATWLDCGLHTLPFLNILYQSFQQLDTQFFSIKQKRVKRLMGDASGIGKAEILVLQA